MSMAPILFSDAATNYSTQGIGSLADALSCYVTEELNGQYELEMTYPVTGRRFKDIKNRRLIYCKPDPYRAGQPFRIYRITKPLNGIVTIYAQHISYDLAGIPVRGFTAQSLSGALAGLVSNAIITNPFTFWTDISSSTQFGFSAPTKCRSLLGGSEGSILDTYGGEYEWDMMTVRLRSRRGQDNGVRIAYGKNLTDITQDENISDLVTGIVGYWTKSDGTVVEGPVVNAPGTYNFSRVVPVDFSSDFEEEPTPQQLEEISQEYISKNGVGVPEVSINVSWVQLEQYSGYEQLNLLERVTLGDTVTVEFPALGVDATARVEKTKYDVLRNRYESADIGSVQANIADTIANQQQQINQMPDVSTVQQISNAITQAILGAKGGAVRLLDTNGDGMPDTLYIADNPDPAKAVKVWRFNYEGWGASSNGYNGPFEMSAALGIGMYAEFITAGTLLASLIKTGIIRSTSGNTEYNLDSGYIRSGPTTGKRFEINSDRLIWFTENGGQSYLTGVLYSVYGETWIGANSKYINFGWVDNTGSPSSVHGMTVEAAPGSRVSFNTAHVDVVNGALGVNGSINAASLTVYGDKQRAVKTPYGLLGLSAMESPEPAFCDFGGGTIGEDGTCPICHSQQYDAVISKQAVRWIVTPTCEHSAWVERTEYGALVHGTPGATFDWMCIGVQYDLGGQYADVSEAPDPPVYMEESEDLDAMLIEQEKEDPALDLWEDETDLDAEMESDTQ